MRRRLLYIYLLLIAGIIACETVIVEAAPNFYFKQLSQQDGLSQNFVRSIMLDHDGFLWVGTKSGISRFDITSLRIIRLFPIQPLLYRAI